MKPYDCLIVGGGAAGIGMGCALQELGVGCFGILERGEIGSSFLRWPQEMRMITPSLMLRPKRIGWGRLQGNRVKIDHPVSIARVSGGRWKVRKSS